MTTLTTDRDEDAQRLTKSHTMAVKAHPHSTWLGKGSNPIPNDPKGPCTFVACAQMSNPLGTIKASVSTTSHTTPKPSGHVVQPHTLEF
ncbi:hypothetical protein HBI67_029270 [Parastagonospora nodorum]|nr:hypothetical protein HBI47_168070 [Parastagonospora nodorum]KAH6023260.1 hypothetical protein HBI83_078010 [Parastagonospora nodorum]KAH6083829.1 hypothetical protein HBI67_029270 [Parastagonospora nodorum]